MTRRTSQLKVLLLAGAASLFACCTKEPEHVVFDEPIRVDVQGNGKDVPSFQLVLAAAHGSPPDALVQPLTGVIAQALKACAEADDQRAHALRAELTFTGTRTLKFLATGTDRYEACAAEKATALSAELKPGSITAARLEARVASRVIAGADAGAVP